MFLCCLLCSCWEKLFDACSREVEAATCRWWFVLRSLCREQSLNAGVQQQHQCQRLQDEESLERVTTSLLGFMEGSTLGEFSFKVQLLQAFVHEMEASQGKLCVCVRVHETYFWSPVSVTWLSFLPHGVFSPLCARRPTGDNASSVSPYPALLPAVCGCGEFIHGGSCGTSASGIEGTVFLPAVLSMESGVCGGGKGGRDAYERVCWIVKGSL